MSRAATLRNHWSFDTDFADSAGSLPGTAMGDAILTNVAVFGGGALSVDGNDAVDLGNDLLPDRDFTWTAWFRTSNLEQNDGTILSNQESANFGAVIRVRNDQFFLRINDYDEEKSDYTATTGSVSSSTWTHVCLSIDSVTGMTFRVNGTLIDSDVAVVKFSNNTNAGRNFAIGSAFDASGLNGFDGVIDDVAIFNGVLDAAQLANVIKYGAVNFERPPDPAGTVLIIR